MKNGKKLTAAVAVSAVATALVAPAAMAATTFTDITGNFAADAINALAAKGILSGNPDGTFAPNGNITREQFAVVLAKALNLDASGTSSFTDVDAWASGYVAAVSKAGFVSGYDATHFGGKDNLTREQMATILVRALTKQQGYDATGKGANLTFTDASSIHSWAKDSVGAAVELGLIHGMTDGTFAPAANATRAQVALVTQAFMNVQINSVTVTASATLNSDNTATVTGKATGSADSVKVTVDGGTAVAATLNTDGTYTYTTNVLASGSHTISVVASKGTTASQPASATVTVGAVGVASVKATDAKHINVVFNTPMNTTQNGDDSSFFTVKGGTTNPVVSSVTWSADGKTATLNLDTAAPTSLVNNTYYTVTVDMTLQDANANALSTTANYNTGFLWNDTTAPTVTGVKSAVGGAVEIDFSKPLGTAPIVVLNGTQVTLNGFVAGETSATVPATWATANLTVGSTVNVIVSGAADQVDDGTTAHAPNTMSLYQGSFVYSLNAVTPVVQSVKATGENQFQITFNEPIDHNASATTTLVDTTGNATLAGTTDNVTALGLKVYDSNGALVDLTTGAPTTSSVTSTDGQTFTVNVPSTVTTGNSTTSLTVNVSGFEDSGNDVGNSVTQAVTLTQDTTAPALINTQYTSDNKIVFTFNKTLSAAADISGDITIVNNTTGVATTVASADVNPVLAGDKTITILNNQAVGATPALLAPGAYTISIAAGSVTDQSDSLNGNAAISQVVTVPSTTSTSGPVVNTAAVDTTPGATPDTILVNYSDAVKGGAQAGSATDVNNYKLNGAALPAGTVISLSGDQKTASVKLPSGTVASSATEVLTVSNVQTLDSVAVGTYNGTVAVTDNTAPTLTAAKVDASGNLVLTFSEDLNGMQDETGTGANVTPVYGDFVVTVNGQPVTLPTTGAVGKGAAENQIVLSGANVSFASGTVVVKTNTVPAHLTGADAAGNYLTEGTSVTATH